MRPSCLRVRAAGGGVGVSEEHEGGSFEERGRRIIRVRVSCFLENKKKKLTRNSSLQAESFFLLYCTCIRIPIYGNIYIYMYITVVVMSS